MQHHKYPKASTIEQVLNDKTKCFRHYIVFGKETNP